MTMAKKLSKSTAGRPDRDGFLTTMLDRASDAFAFDTEQRRRVVEDMKFTFVSGHQWDEHLTKKRRNRPCYEFNRIRQLIRRVTGQQLKNKPEIKVRAVEDNDVDTAEIINGLIKNIEVQSSAENAYDTAFQWACGGGYGVLRVVAEYESDESFDQCLKIKTVQDPMTVWFDPSAREFDRSDARYVFVTEVIPRSEFQRRWPKAEVVDFDHGPFDEHDRQWWFDDSVRIAEYWYVEDEPKKLYMLSDGTVVSAEEFDPIRDDAEALGLTVKTEREVMGKCVYTCLVSGAGKLEEPTKWGGSMIPIIPQWGDLVTIEGKRIYSGMTRFGRDAQTIHNFELSTLVEVMAKQPNSPLTATTAMINGLESYYERLGYDDPPVLLYNVDPAAPAGRPQREQPAQFPAAFAQLSAVATDDLKANLGVYCASIGARSNESSGRAILARQTEGEVANFVYVDNQIKALKRLGEVLVDAIPKYYDADRSIRILGEENAEKYVRINRPMIDQQTGETHIINDLSRGRYDVTVTVGKNFDTARMELAETAQSLATTPGPMGAIGQYLLLKSLDTPGATEAVKAARKLMVNQGLLEPGEGDQPPPPPQPNPKDVADAALKSEQAKKTAAEAEGQQLDNQIVATQFGMELGAAGLTPPTQAPMGGPPPDIRSPSLPPAQAQPIRPEQPPQGGFSL